MKRETTADGGVQITFTPQEADVVSEFLSPWQSETPDNAVFALRDALSGKDI